jgi:hypothetical protein
MNKKIAPIKKSGGLRKADIFGLVVAGMFLLILWTTCVINFISGNFMGYRNYYGQPVGTFILLIVLAVATPVYVIVIIRLIRKQKIESYPVPAWMKEPPWKWPWS